MRRAALALVAACILTIVMAVPISEIGLTQVTLNCSDGTTMTVVVDTETLTGLTQAVQALVDYPAELTCTLLQTPLLTALGGVAFAAPNEAFVVGGGRWLVPCANAFPGEHARIPGAWASWFAPGPAPEGFFWVNIAVNAHKKTDGTVVGTLNETIPENQSCTVLIGGVSTEVAVGASHFTSRRVFATFTPNQAYVDSLVTHTSGVNFPTGTTFSPDPALEPDVTHVQIAFEDNGNPAPGTQPGPDLLNGIPNAATFTQSGLPCDALTFPDPSMPLNNGNISVRP